MVAVFFMLQMKTAETQENYLNFSGLCGLYLAEPNAEPNLPILNCVFPPHSCSLASEPVKKVVIVVWEQSDKGPACLLEAGIRGSGQRQQSTENSAV